MAKKELDQKKIIARIKACLELSKDGSYQAEADTAMRMAKKLMAKHDLSLSDVELFNSPDNIIEKICVEGTKLRHRWDHQIAWTVSALFNVTAIRGKQRVLGKWSATVGFIGYTKDVVLAKETYIILRVTAISMGAAYSPIYKQRQSYLLGLTQCLLSRAKEEAPLPPAEQVKYGALVVTKEANIKIWTKANTDVKGEFKPSGPSDIDQKAYDDGHDDGEIIALKNKKEVETN